jgi:hypothetical protein
MYEFYERTMHWVDLLGAELVEVPALARAQAAFWRSIHHLYEEALAGSEDDLLAKTTAGLLHPSTFGALQAAGLSVDESAEVVADFLAHEAGEIIDESLLRLVVPIRNSSMGRARSIDAGRDGPNRWPAAGPGD